MKSLHVLMLSLLLPVLAACGPKPADTTAPATEAATAESADDTATPAPEAAPAGDAPEAAAPTATPDDTAANDNPVAPPQGPAPVPGVDYVEIPNAQPYAPLNGQIEVVEVFGYVCPACARFAPEVSVWKKKQPADVRVTYVPVVFGPKWAPYAKAFYAAEAKGLVDKTHDAMFSAIHLQGSMPGETKPTADDATLAAFYARHGANAQEFTALMNSFGTNAKVGRGMQFAQRTGVQGTPTIVVNGKYRVTGGQTYADVLRIADHLIAQERALR